MVLSHSTELAQHVPEQFRPKGKLFIDELTLAEIEHLKTGPQGTGKIPTLQSLLAFINRERPGTDMVLNLEIKDVQGTKCPRRQPSIEQLALQEIHEANFSLARIRFSSFSLDSLEKLACLEPKANIGMLFDVPSQQGGDVDRKIFVDGQEKYRGFTLAVVAEVLEHIPQMKALHPEIQTLTSEMVALAAQHKLSIATWGWKEKSPFEDTKFANATSRAIELCRQYDVPLSIITDHAAAMHKLIASLPTPVINVDSLTRHQPVEKHTLT
jgi:glycerophosphoryl diester phosphodiesterase